MNIELIVKWRVKESELSRILALLPELAGKSKEEEGNLLYSVYQSESDGSELILHERYRDAEAVETHKSSEHYQRIVVKEILPHLVIREVVRVRKLF